MLVATEMLRLLIDEMLTWESHEPPARRSIRTLRRPLLGRTMQGHDERKACLALEVERACYRAAMATAENGQLERTDIEIKIRGLTRGTAHLRVRRLRLCQRFPRSTNLATAWGHRSMNDEPTEAEIEEEARDLVWHYGFEWARLSDDERAEYREMAKRCLARLSRTCVWADAEYPCCKTY